ncbi:MAG: FtsQ-type POTRA domain-containing protein [Smithellaceae bacterium]|nr:FtsQ-type POTRA domain-containing protein [Syntrophaceae bacterium]MDD4241183.1 FtsQ-type POTRA domain-containing protein [Smithellaceae bacterium]NLX51543.1 FtsQ-type POTRA domain-containing protein [Deltaproteobacteria bacterium]
MNGKIRGGLEARKNRLRRRMIGALGESFAAAVLLFSAALLGAAFIYAYSAVLSASYLQIREVSVRGVKELTEKDILALAKIAPQANLLSVSADAVSGRIRANPWIRTVYIGREFPDRLVIEVRERTPVALVKQAGTFYLMDADGFVFKKLSRSDDVDLAIMTGVNIQAGSQPAVVSEALKLLQTLGEEPHASLGTISEISVDEVFGLSILTDRGLHLKLGRDNFEGKIRRLDIVLADLEKRGMKDGRLFVDLTDVAKVTVQRKDALGKAQNEKSGPQYRI